MHCSFCHQPAGPTLRLISSPSQDPHRAYICDECISVCVTILADDQPEPTPEPGEPHPWLDHPLAGDLMRAVTDWTIQESLGSDAAGELARVRDIARRMLVRQ